MRSPIRSARDTSTFRHGLRVRMGVHGPSGKLLKCERRNGTGHYWKVCLDSRAWVWPDDFIIDGPGTHVAVCNECALPFMTPRPDDTLCPDCDERMFGTRARATEPPEESAAARTWRRQHPMLKEQP